MKKYLAEAVGTFVLTLLGCGTAVSLACGSDTDTIGGISGCHINPAITLGCLMTKRISCKDAIWYMVAQTVGAIIAAAVLYVFTQYSGASFDGTLTGANNCNGCSGSQIGGLIVEVVLTFIFVLVVLGTTDAKKGAGNFAGLAIGLSLILIHLVGIHYTGTSVNPARSIGPALFEGGIALTDLWVFIAGPFIGAALAACTWKAIGEE